MIPYNMGQKISCLTKVQCPRDNYPFLLVFLGDGTVKKVKLVNSKLYTSSVEQYVEIETVAKFPVAAKMVGFSF